MEPSLEKDMAALSLDEKSKAGNDYTKDDFELMTTVGMKNDSRNR